MAPQPQYNPNLTYNYQTDREELLNASRNAQMYCMNNGSHAGNIQHFQQRQRNQDRHVPVRPTLGQAAPVARSQHPVRK